MTGWWTQLSARERLALVVLVGVLAFVIMLFGIVRPLVAWRGNAAADFARYTDIYERTTMAVAAPQDDRPSTSELRPVLTATADAAGITITTVGPPEAGAVDISVTAPRIDVFYRWVSQLEAEHGVQVDEALVRQLNTGTGVAARLTLIGS